MKIYVAGLPGSGKTTQAIKIGEQLNLGVAKMGDILREIANSDSARGREIREVMVTGDLLSDEIVSEIMREEVCKEEYSNGFVMEGFPRTKNQISLFDPEFDKVVVLKVSLDSLLNRLAERGRGDDSAHTVRVRLEAQLTGLKEVLKYYEGQPSSSNEGKIIVIDGEQGIEDVFKSIMEKLDEEKPLLYD